MTETDCKHKLTKRQIQANETREKIYNTAFRLITDRGFENVTVDEICSESGVAKGSFYHYFNSKDDIIVETYKIVDRKFSDEAEHFPPHMTSFDKILTTVCFQAKYAQMKGVDFVRQIYKNQLEAGTDFFISEDRPYFKILKKSIEEGITKGEIREGFSSIELTRWVLSFSRGITYDWCLHGGNYDIGEVMERVFKIVMKNFENS